MIEVVAENSFSIVRQILFRIGLTGLCAQFREGRGFDLLGSQHVHFADTGANSFVNLNVNGQMVVVALIVVLHLGLDLDLAESARPVQTF